MNGLGLYAVGPLSLILGAVSLPFALRRDQLTQVRGRLVLAVSAAGILLTVLIYLGVDALPSSLGALVVASPGLACAAAIATFALPRWRVPPAGPVRTAALDTREPASLVRRSATTALIVLTAVLLAAIALGGLTASDDDMGRPSRAFAATRGDVSSMSTPYAGWYYGVPALVGLVALLVALALGLRRLAYLPALTDDAEVDLAWRRTAARGLAALAGAAILMYIAVFAMLLRPASVQLADLGSPGPWGALQAVALGVMLVAALGACVAALVSVVSGGTVGRGVPTRERVAA